MNRLACLKAGYARTARLAAAIRAAADDETIVLVRLAPGGGVAAYNERFRAVELDDDAVEAIGQLLHGARPGIDWTVGHDWNLTTGNLRRTAAVGEPGHAPEKELMFGGYAPVFLADTAAAPATPAAHTPRAAG